MKTFAVAISIVATILVGSAAADENVEVSAVLTDLNRPCGIAARLGRTADRYEMFIAESGAGRVVQWASRTPDTAREVITGFPTAAATDPFHQTGPLGLLFVDPDLLVVAGASDTKGCLSVYELPDEGQTLTADEAIDRPDGPSSHDSTVNPIAGYSLTRTRANEFVQDMILATIRDERQRGALYASRVQAGVVGPLKLFWVGGSPGQSRRVTAVATSNSGHLVVGEVDPSASEPGCRLTFLNPIDGSVEMQMRLDLVEIVALAYSSITGRLYAADFASSTPERGGIYRIDDASEPGRPACRAVKIADLRGPTALAFAPDGALFVTTFGDADNNGTLVVLTGDL